MSYSVYLDKQIAFHHLSKEEALERQKQLRQMIHAGVKSSYSAEEVTIGFDSI